MYSFDNKENNSVWTAVDEKLKKYRLNGLPSTDRNRGREIAKQNKISFPLLCIDFRQCLKQFVFDSSR